MHEIRVANVRFDAVGPDEVLVYCGRGSVSPTHCAGEVINADLGNPFRMEDGYSRDEAVDAFASWAAQQCADTDSDVFSTVAWLADKVLAGEKLVLGCWCSPRRCHAEEIKRLVENLVAVRMGPH